jgi:hypothetical protein
MNMAAAVMPSSYIPHVHGSNVSQTMLDVTAREGTLTGQISKVLFAFNLGFSQGRRCDF